MAENAIIVGGVGVLNVRFGHCLVTSQRRVYEFLANFAVNWCRIAVCCDSDSFGSQFSSAVLHYANEKGGGPKSYLTRS